MSRTLALAEQLIARPSATPEDAGCLELIASHLAPLGFQCERIDSGPDTFRVSNLWAIKRSKITNAKTLVFAGHTDVVPTGPIA
jgi:succinyl-diaminopimelate desuccinylase